MKKHFLMDCQTSLNCIYESEKQGCLPLFTKIRLQLHLLFCSNCMTQLRNLQFVVEIMKADFLPPSPNLEDILMKCLTNEADISEEIDAPAGFSFRSWVIIGFFLLFSLSSTFFGLNFIQIAASEGLSFLLPVSLTIGMVLTCYGALFIASHLKDLSTRFRLH